MIKISERSKRSRVKNRPNMLKSFYTKCREKRQQEGKQIIFIDETYLDYNKRCHGMWNIKKNYWNEGPNI